MDKPPKHIIAYGIAGTGKSHFASTTPTPQWIAMFDPIGKETPYTDKMFVDTYEDAPVEQQPSVLYAHNPPLVIPTWDCFSDPDCKELTRRIVWFHDSDPDKPSAYDAYEAIRPRLRKIFTQLGIKTFILDSVTMLCVALRNKFAIEGTTVSPGNTKIEDGPRGWANLATDELEATNFLINDLPINTVTVCHSDFDTKPGRNQEYPQVGVQAYGRMKERLLITTGDVYRCFHDGKEFKMSVSGSNLYVGNNSFKISGIFPNDWKEISKADKTNVTFVQRRRD